MEPLLPTMRPTVQRWGRGGTTAASGVDLMADEFLDALLSADRVAAFRIASSAVDRGMRLPDVHLHVIQWAMSRIGHLWETGKISVAAEHTATAIVQFVVTSLYPLMQRSETMRGHAVVAGVAGEAHQLGAHLVSDALESDGWQVRFLGVDCSQSVILDACADPQLHLLALSCTMIDNLDELRQVIAAVRAKCTGWSLPWILVGGQAFGSGLPAHEQALRLGADALALDLNGAVAVARAWADPHNQIRQRTGGDHAG